MAKVATVTLTADVIGEDLDAGPQSIGTITNGNSPSRMEVYQLLLGNIALQFPLNTNLNYLVLDSNELSANQTLVLKGNSGDVGVSVSSSYPSLIPIANTYPVIAAGPLPQTQCWLQASGPGSIKVAWF